MIACMHKLLTAIYSVPKEPVAIVVSAALNLDPLSEVVELEMIHLAAIWITSKREGDLSSSRRCLLLHLEVTPELKSSEAAATPTRERPLHVG
jgi:hypothetical protein